MIRHQQNLWHITCTIEYNCPWLFSASSHAFRIDETNKSECDQVRATEMVDKLLVVCTIAVDALQFHTNVAWPIGDGSSLYKCC